jgi:uncharacterized protein YecE (DUF72 family)
MVNYIGTAGYMITRQEWLKIGCLNCIEINSTFYHTPSDKMVSSWLQFPEHIKLSIKAPKYITHIKRLHDIDEPWLNFWNKIKMCQDKIVSVIFQVPPSYNNMERNVQRILHLKTIFPNNIQIVIEFRNKSWFSREIYDLFNTQNILICGTYINKKQTDNWMGTMPGGYNFGNPLTDTSYLRIHGKKGYKGELNENEIKELLQKVKIGGHKNNIIIFNNTFFNNYKHIIINNKKMKYAAVANAIQLSQIH